MVRLFIVALSMVGAFFLLAMFPAACKNAFGNAYGITWVLIGSVVSGFGALKATK